ncbi:MAG: hypothetical protein NZM44_05220 [Candidatus Calescibacterium sp.]|nr:hypothetical protein [Candidatus Calescibacterium sp.]
MKTYVLGTHNVTIDIINCLLGKIKIDGVVGLSKREENDKISGYIYMADYCKQKSVNFVEVEDYNLKTEDDKKKLLELEIDVLLVLGWQRLIPNWLIKHCRIGVFGIHGSSKGIVRGRGRSPQNWAIILGEKTFSLSLFNITEGIDEGPIVETREYELSIFDDIKTSYYKVSILSAEMILAMFKKLENNNLCYQEQFGEPRYLPQRLPSDGQIDWNRSSMEIYNFIRALTKPYPGAFTVFNNNIIKIWKAIPFNLDIEDYSVPGQVVKVFHDGEILVKTLDSFLLIQDYDTDIIIKEGSVFESVSFSDQIKKIIHRHNMKYPHLKIIEEIEILAK